MFSGEINDRKERKKVENISKQRALVPKQNERREGATVAASHLPSLSGPCDCALGRTGSKQRLLQTIGRYSLNTRKDLTTKRRRFSDSTDWPSKTDETNETKKCSRV